MSNHKKITKRLSQLYPTVPLSKLVLDDAEISTSEIEFSTASRVNWNNIVNYVKPRGKLKKLIQTVLDENEDDELLQTIIEEMEITPYRDASKVYSDASQYLSENQLENLQEGLRLLLANGNYQEVLDRLGTFAKEVNAKKFRSDLIQASDRLNRLENDSVQGILTRENYNIEKNRITHSINYYINKIDDEQKIRQILDSLLRPSKIDTSTSSNLNVPIASGFEKILGGKKEGHYLKMEWLKNALEKEKFVCKVDMNKGSGTGFIVKGGYVLTNHHVICRHFPDLNQCTLDCLKDNECPLKGRILLNYQKDQEDQAILYELDPTNGYYTNKDLDYALIKIKDNPSRPLKEWGLATFEIHKTPQKGDLVSIIQHPNGEDKKLGVPNTIIEVWEEKKYLFYKVDTDEGSSGAPVFNKNWKVIGLHHAGKTQIERGFQVSATRREEANRGILIKPIIEDLKKKGVDIEQ